MAMERDRRAPDVDTKEDLSLHNQPLAWESPLVPELVASEMPGRDQILDALPVDDIPTLIPVEDGTNIYDEPMLVEPLPEVDARLEMNREAKIAKGLDELRGSEYREAASDVNVSESEGPTSFFGHLWRGTGIPALLSAGAHAGKAIGALLSGNLGESVQEAASAVKDGAVGLASGGLIAVAVALKGPLGLVTGPMAVAGFRMLIDRLSSGKQQQEE